MRSADSVDRVQQVAVALLCVAPLAIIPGGENRFVFGKIAVFAAGVAVACFATPRGRLPRGITGLLIAGFALTALSAGLGSSPLEAIAGAAPRYEGLPTLALYAGCGWAGARLLGPTASRATVRALEWSLTATAVAIAFIAVLETAGLRPLSSNVSRPGSLIGNASDEAALGVLIAGTLGWIALRRGIMSHTGRRESVVALVGAGAASVVVALSASRAALVGLVAVAVILALGAPARRRVVLIGAVAAVAVVTLVAPAPRGRVTGSSPLATATVHGRLLLWEETLGLIGHHPAVGIGPGMFVNEITREHDLRWQEQVGPANPPDSPHDWLLQVAATGGLLLLGVVGAICVPTALAGRRLLRSERTRVSSDEPGRDGVGIGVGAFAGLVGYGVALLFGFTAPGTTPLAAVLGGAVLAQAPLLNPAEPEWSWSPRTIVRWLIAAGATALVVLAILGSAAEIQLREALHAAAAGDVSTADSHFGAAGSLRSWDSSIEGAAGHAFVVIAQSRSSEAELATDRAAYWIGKARRDRPHDEQVELDAAALAEVRSDYTNAEALLRGVLGRDKQNPAVLLRLGVVQGESGALAQAADTLLEVTRIDPTSPDPWDDLAIVYRLEGHPDLAARAASRAQQLRR